MLKSYWDCIGLGWKSLLIREDSDVISTFRLPSENRYMFTCQFITACLSGTQYCLHGTAPGRAHGEVSETFLSDHRQPGLFVKERGN